MKITGGRSRGRALSTLKGMDIRPTSSKVREAIFNILGQDMSGLRVLDIFAGTGIMGIEALSRGAGSAVFIDKSGRSVQLIKKNLALCGYEDVSRVLQRDVSGGPGFESLMEMGRFDLVFIDPPYRKALVPHVLERLSDSGVLNRNAVVITETSEDEPLPERAGGLIRTGVRKYGETKIDFYERELDK